LSKDKPLNLSDTTEPKPETPTDTPKLN
jgi:hypothetical protein